jgi:cell division protein FtsZ
LITIPNERLLSMVDPKTSITDAFQIADDVLHQGIAGISDLITKPGMINLDFADVRTIMRDAGSALMAIGFGEGENRTIEAAKQAIESPLLETSIQGATGVLYNVTGGRNLTLLETSEAAEIIRAAVDEDAEIIYGTSIDESLGDAVKITLIATGFDEYDAYSGYGRGGRSQQRGRAPQQSEPVYRINPRQDQREAPPARERSAAPERDRRREAPPQNQPSRGNTPAPMLPDDDWEGDSSIIRFLRER